ncbi:cytochrome C oxidase subunit IV family protein [Acidobacteriota bacterium]
MTDEKNGQHVVPYSLYVKIWIALVVLTIITVSVSYLDMKKFTVFTAMIIATIKSGLVLLYFMNIRFEKIIYPVMILFVMATYAIFIILIFSDYAFR